MRKPALILFGASLVLAGCKAKTETAASPVPNGTSAATTPSVSSNPDVERVQTVVNQKNQGRACLSFNMSGKFQATTGEASVDFSTQEADSPQYKQFNFLAQHGVVDRKESRLDGQSYVTFTPKRSIREADGQGFFVEDGRYLDYCFGKWTVIAAQLTKKFQAPDPQSEAFEATVKLTDAPAWAMTSAAHVLTLPSKPSVERRTLMVAMNELGKPVPARLDAPSTIWIQVPRQ